MGKSERRALISQLIRVMMHIIKWFSQPGKRSGSWMNSINSGRREIRRIIKRRPSLKNTINEEWDTSFQKAKQEAENEMNAPSKVNKLTEKQVFDDNYTLDDENNQ